MANGYFKVKCIMEGGIEHTYGVSKSRSVRTAEDAVNFCTEIVGYHDDRPVTRQHFRDPVTGEYTSIVSAEPVRKEEFAFDDATLRHVNAIAEAPRPKKE